VRKRYLLLAVSGTILGLLWWRVGWRALASGVAGLHYPLFAVAIALFVPQVLVSGWRWHRLVHPRGEGDLRRSVQLVLAASALNVVLPSKLGDVAKGLFAVSHERPGSVEHGLALGIFEKGIDTASLAFWMVLASFAVPPQEPLGWAMVATGVAIVLAVGGLVAVGRGLEVGRSAGGVVGRVVGLMRRIAAVGAELRADRARLVAVLAASLALWFLHIAQFAVVQAAAGGAPRPLLVASRVPMAIFVGLLPVSFAGVGTRDAAMVYLLAGPLGDSAALVLGLFATLRYVVVAVAGIPYLSHLDFTRLRRAQQQSSAATAPVSVATGDTIREPGENTPEVDR